MPVIQTSEPWISRARFEELVEVALSEIPDALWEYVENLGVMVAEWPSAGPTRGCRNAAGQPVAWPV